jgi:hypothetical protein
LFLSSLILSSRDAFLTCSDKLITRYVMINDLIFCRFLKYIFFQVLLRIIRHTRDFLQLLTPLALPQDPKIRLNRQNYVNDEIPLKKDKLTTTGTPKRWTYKNY